VTVYSDPRQLASCPQRDEKRIPDKLAVMVLCSWDGNNVRSHIIHHRLVYPSTDLLAWRREKSIPPTLYKEYGARARMHVHTHTHTHPFYSPLDIVWDYLGEPLPEPIQILLEQETVSGSGISWAICKSAPHPIQITTPAPHHTQFLQAHFAFTF